MKHLKPARPDLVIFIPGSRPRKQVPADGVTVDERLPFWARRLREGSMIAVDPPAEPAPLLDTGNAPLFDPANKDVPPARVIPTLTPPEV